MQYSTLFAAIITSASIASASPVNNLEARQAQTVTLKYDPNYDNANLALTSVSCSNGNGGLLNHKGWTTLGTIPQGVNGKGGYGVIALPGATWGSAKCGTCWRIYNKKNENRGTAWVIVADANTSPDGRTATVGLNLMNYLTGNQGEFLGRYEARIEPMACPSNPNWR